MSPTSPDPASGTFPDPPDAPDAPDAPEPPIIPFPEADVRPALDAAIALWEALAARAWQETVVQGRGRGLQVVDLGELRAAAAEGRDPETTFLPVSIVPKGDDFRGLLLGYDWNRQVLLLVVHPAGGETVLALEQSGTARPAPEDCHARRAAAPPPAEETDR